MIAQLDGNISLQDDESTLNETGKMGNANIEDEKDTVKQTPFKLEVKIAAKTHDCAREALKLNILYILDYRVEPTYLPWQSSFDLGELARNEFPHIFVFKVTLPEDIVYIDDKEFSEDWRNNVKGL